MPDDTVTPDADPDPGREAAPGTDGEDEAPRGSRAWTIAAVVAVIAAVGSMAVLGWLLLGGGGEADTENVRACVLRDFTKEAEEDAACPPKDATATAGLVTKTSEGSFTMRELIDGRRLGDELTLNVREPDRPYIDIAHAQTHASLGQPVCVYTQEIDGEDAVIYMNDVCDPTARHGEK